MQYLGKAIEREEFLGADGWVVRDGNGDLLRCKYAETAFSFVRHNWTTEQACIFDAALEDNLKNPERDKAVIDADAPEMKEIEEGTDYGRPTMSED